MVDAASYPEISGRLGISSVPATFANGKDGVVGAVPEQALLKLAQKVMH
jgi:thioredoxin-like negative regulator of GroEL